MQIKNRMKVRHKSHDIEKEMTTMINSIGIGLYIEKNSPTHLRN